jgi:DNA-directed RNA polymerase subunit RPC12/RpoP
MKCPFCGHKRFYMKDGTDGYEIYGFTCETGEVCFDADVDTTEIQKPADDSHIYCEKCAWNGKLGDTRCMS